jgi:transitional endoplasmic reticulum ATPase
MHGVPGNGKTISLKAIINSMSRLPVPIPSLYVKSFQGSAGVEFSIRNIFDHARIMAPCLLIFEDLDSLVEKNTRSYFLNEVDGLESNDGILMIGSTNHFEKLDPAISKRPSRFDRKYHFKLPSEEERAAYAHYWRRKLIDTDIVYFPGELCPIIAKLTAGFSFAYMKELFVISLLTIARGTVGQAEDLASDDGIVIIRDDTLIEPDDVGNDSASDSESRSDSGDDFQVRHKDKRRPAPPRVKRIVPVVEVPVNLEDNALLKALRTQVKVLLDEMDTTDECQWPSSRRGVGSRRGGPPRGPPPGMPPPPMHY